MSSRRAVFAATVIAVLSLVVQNAVTQPASAEKDNVVTLKSMSPDDLKKKCDEAGGRFSNYGSDWLCSAEKGSVSCNSKQCTGVTSGGSASAPATKSSRDPQTALDIIINE
jgi:hypothetical protein